MLEKIMKFGLWQERLSKFWNQMAVLLTEDGYFYMRKGDNNYSISMAIFGYNPKLS